MNNIPARISVTLLFLFFYMICTSQTVIEGHLKNRVNRTPVCDAVCTITLEQNSEPLGYALSDAEGYFRIALYLESDSICLNIAHLSYGAQMFRLPNKNGLRNFELDEKILELQEVRVKGSPIWSVGDTLNYNVGAFQSQQDRVIGDVLKKLPGIEVSKEGSISYQGKPINRFYVEGMDLLQNKYSIATNNIPVDAVERVQVMENHQPVKALQDVKASENAAINLKLREDKKGAWAFNAEAGSGGNADGVLWQGKATAMQFGHKRQTIGVFKTNNTGHNLLNEFSGHSLGTSDLYSGEPPFLSDLVSPVSLSTPPLEESRYLDNKSYAFSLNNLWKIDENKSLRVQATWLKDRRRQILNEWSKYYLGDVDSSLFIDEWQILRQSENRGEVVLSFTNNAPSIYVDNTFKLYGRWTDIQSTVTGTSDLFQRFKTPLLVAQNNFELVRNKNGKTLQFYSFCRYSGQSQRLEVLSDSALQEATGLILQHTERNVFQTMNRVVGSRSVGRSVFSAELGFNASLEHMSSDLSDNRLPGILEISNENNIRWNRIEAAIAPRYNYTGTKIKIELYLPVVLTDLQANDKAGNTKSHDFKALVNPALSFRYVFNPYLEMRLSGNFQREIGDMLDFADGLRMLNYRTFTYGSGILEERKSQTVSLRLLFRNQVESLFANLSVLYRPQYSNVIRKTKFIGDNKISFGEYGGNNRKNLFINAYAGKYFGEIKTNVTMNLGYTRINYKQYQQSLILPLTSNSCMAGLKVDTDPVKWCNLKLDVIFSGNKITSDTYKSKMLSQVQAKGGWFVFPSDNWQLYLKGEYLNNELARDKRMNLFFCDLGIKYSKQRWEITADWTNIFNKRAYEYTSYDGVNTQGSYYRLRPAGVLFTVGFRI